MSIIHTHRWRLGTLGEFPTGIVGCDCGARKPFDLLEEYDMPRPVCRMERSLLDVTSMHRPDLNWSFTDKAGHLHVWHEKGQTLPANGYTPIKSYEVPTTEWEITGQEFYDEDDEPHDVGHYICTLCKEEIQHGYTADTNTQYIPGLVRYYVDDVSVSEEEYMKALYGGRS